MLTCASESKEQCHFVLNYCDNLTLLSYATKLEEGLDLDIIRHVVRTVVDSVCYLHRRGVTDLRISADTIYLVLGEDKYPSYMRTMAGRRASAGWRR